MASSLLHQLMQSYDDDDDDEDMIEGVDKDDHRHHHLKNSLENKIAKKILIMNMPELLGGGSLTSIQGGGGKLEDDEGLHHRFPQVGGAKGEKGKKNKAGTDTKEKENTRGRRYSIVQHNDFIQFVDRFNQSRPNNSGNNNSSSTAASYHPVPPSSSHPSSGKTTSNLKEKRTHKMTTGVNGGGSVISASGSLVQEKSSVLSFPDYPSKKRKLANAKKSNKSAPIVIYDPASFADACSGDFLIPNTVADYNKGISEREERLVSLVNQCCVAKGKVKQLSTIKEVSFRRFTWFGPGLLIISYLGP
jgi:hypothetical protein